MKVLVTGSTGFAGPWICRKLLEEGHQVHILRRQNSDLSEVGSLNVTHLIGDVTNRQSVFEAVGQVDHVFHLAGVVGYSKAQRELMNQVNVLGTRHVVDACIEKGIGKLLYFSSVVAVGAGFNQHQVLNEDSKYNVGHLNLGYFETKKQAEDIVLNAAKHQGLHAVAVNPSTIYGPGDARKGSRKIQLKVARGKFKFYTAGGASIISISDVVNAAYTAWEKGISGERYILSGDNITIKRLFAIIAECAGVKAPGIFLPNTVLNAVGKAGDLLEAFNAKGPLNSENARISTMYHWFDHEKARKHLGLNPVSAEIAIEQSVRWMKDNRLI